MTCRTLLSLGCAALTALPAAAHAEGMTEKAIQAFLDESTALTHQDTGLSDSDVTAYLQNHLSASGHYVSDVTFSIPGYPPQTKKMTLDKKGFIDNVIQGRQAMQNYTSSVDLTSADIDKDSAEIKTVTTESGHAPMPDGTYVPFDGRSECAQTLELGENDTVILTAAACQTTVTYKEQ